MVGTNNEDAPLSESNRCDSSRENQPSATVPQSAAPGSTYTPGSRVDVWTGETGIVSYVTADGWVGIRLDGETVVHEWQADQVALSEVAS